MNHDNQAALDLFSNYSDFMLTDDELLAIHGGATNSGSASTSDSGSSAAATSAPPAAPPAPPPQAPPAPPNLSPANVSVGITLDLTPPVTEVTHAVVNSDTAGAVDNFGANIVNAVNNFFFGPDTPSAPPQISGEGGAGGAHGAGGSGG